MDELFEGKADKSTLAVGLQGKADRSSLDAKADADTLEAIQVCTVEHGCISRVRSSLVARVS